MGPKHCKIKHMANLDWDLDGPMIPLFLFLFGISLLFSFCEFPWFLGCFCKGFVRAAPLQNEACPENVLTRHETGFEKREQKKQKTNDDPKRVQKYLSRARKP